MRRTINPRLIVVVVAVIMAVAAWLHQWRRIHMARVQMQHAQRESENAVVALAGLERSVSAARAEIQRLSAGAGGPPAARVGETAPPQPAKGGSLDIHQLFVEHPEWRAIYKASEKTAFLHRYAAFIASAGLSAEQRDQFATELMRHDENKTDTSAVTRQHAEGKVDRGALDWDAALAELHAVLSPNQFNQFQRIREKMELQNKMNQIVRRAARGR